MLRRLSIRLLLGIFAILAVLAPGAGWADTSVSGLRVGEHPDGVTRFVLDLSEAADFRIRLSDDPYRVIIESGHLAWMTVPALKRPTGVVEGVRYSEAGAAGRMVLALRQPARVKQAFVLSPREGVGWRFVLDLKEVSRQEFLAEAASPPRTVTAVVPADAAGQASLPAATPATPPPQPAKIVVTSPAAAQPPPPEAAPLSVLQDRVSSASDSAPASTPEMGVPAGERGGEGGALLSAPMPAPQPRPAATPAVAAGGASVGSLPLTKVAAPVPAPSPEPKAKMPRGEYRPMIVIDPGHGGVDPGAIGVSGIYEKNITLAVARELRRRLERTGRYRVHLTRDGDVFIPLHDRVAIARQYKADLFISLHADVVKDPQIRGLSVYTLSQTASDTEAQALADSENKVDLIAGIDLSHESADVANILIDLAQRETMNRSAVFAGDLVEELGREISLLTNTHRFAGFAVLKGPDVPAVLIETGYLSNESEERSLRQPEYRGRLARAITRAVDRFFQSAQKGKQP
ncbi:MAG: N-acetylmuramoyl-L-alanine amidase [Magnetospirillum sp.]|nr:N-acetylmuramoyl-L-alanine amidase [Magnetospirillum sp.]